jgi:anti-sigma factor RsiW
MNEHRPVSEADLHAYADGFLDQADCRRVEEHLAENPEMARMVADWQAQNDGLKNAFAPYAISRSTDGQLIAGTAVLSKPALYRRLATAAAVGFIFMVGGLVGHFAPMLIEKPSTEGEGLAQEARNAYLIYASEVRHPVEVFADQEAHLASWLGKRLSIADLRIPNLHSIGFRLIGGRLLPVADKPGALFMYEDKTGRRVTVLVGRNEESRRTSFRIASSESVETFYWIDGDLGYAVTGDIPRELLQAIAQECYRQFDV